MSPRSEARQAVLEALYAVDVGEFEEDKERIREMWEYCVLQHNLKEKAALFGENLFKTTLRNKKNIDEIIKLNLQNWIFPRVAMIDRNILRIGVCEIIFFPDIPRKVAIDEAIELAKTYSTKDSGRFVNGILDNITEKSFDELSSH